MDLSDAPLGGTRSVGLTTSCNVQHQDQSPHKCLVFPLCRSTSSAVFFSQKASPRVETSELYINPRGVCPCPCPPEPPRCHMSMLEAPTGRRGAHGEAQLQVSGRV